MTLVRIILVTILGLLMATSTAADTGQLREVFAQDGLRVLVFTSPTPLRSGPVEVAALVTEERGGAPVTDFEFILRVRRPEWEPGTPSLIIGGGYEPGDSFAQKAMFDLPGEGDWVFEVEVEVGVRVARTELMVIAGEPMPEWWDLLPYILLCVPFAMLVVARDHLQRGARSGAAGRGRAAAR